jgi:hypothetical protein
VRERGRGTGPSGETRWQHPSGKILEHHPGRPGNEDGLDHWHWREGKKRKTGFEDDEYPDPRRRAKRVCHPTRKISRRESVFSTSWRQCKTRLMRFIHGFRFSVALVVAG